jgi:hypothetical protein
MAVSINATTPRRASRRAMLRSVLGMPRDRAAVNDSAADIEKRGVIDLRLCIVGQSRYALHHVLQGSHLMGRHSALFHEVGLQAHRSSIAVMPADCSSAELHLGPLIRVVQRAEIALSNGARVERRY